MKSTLLTSAVLASALLLVNCEQKDNHPQPAGAGQQLPPVTRTTVDFAPIDQLFSLLGNASDELDPKITYTLFTLRHDNWPDTTLVASYLREGGLTVIPGGGPAEYQQFQQRPATARNAIIINHSDPGTIRASIIKNGQLGSQMVVGTDFNFDLNEDEIRPPVDDTPDRPSGEPADGDINQQLSALENLLGTKDLEQDTAPETQFLTTLAPFLDTLDQTNDYVLYLNLPADTSLRTPVILEKLQTQGFIIENGQGNPNIHRDTPPYKKALIITGPTPSDAKTTDITPAFTAP